MIRFLECPICGNPVAASVEGQANCFPFCSPRCRQVDLLRWCDGRYSIVESLTPERLIQELEEDDLAEGLEA
ncbi:MAG: DNA gyrase inhibitor YacG [Planctomycetaceae bacterium]